MSAPGGEDAQEPEAAPGGEAREGEAAAGAAPTTRRRLSTPVRAALAIVAVAGLAVLGAVLFSGGAAPIPGLGSPPASHADAVPYDGRSPLLVSDTEQRVLVELLRPALGEQANARALGADEQRRRIKSLKREQMKLRSGLEARGIVFRDVVAYYRVWNGFAATVKTSDVARLTYPGARVRTARRVYSATSEPVPVPAKDPIPKAGLTATAPIAVLDTGVDAKALNGHADPGYDAVDRDRDAAPGKDDGRTESSGTALAGVLSALGERVLPIRVASFRAAGGAIEAEGTTDELLAGLEHAVDPNGDGDTSDHVPVALVGVNAPYAGFTNSPEAEAVRGAEGLGTLVVAPAGNEGAAAPGSGTVGSPASARDALAVGALTGPEPAPRTRVTLDGKPLADAAVLAGDPPEGGKTAGPVSSTDPAVLGRAQTRIRNRVVIVKAGVNPGAQAAAAAAVGARAVVLASPGDTPLAAVAAGRAAAPVIGVTGEAAETLLKAEPGTAIEFGETERGEGAKDGGDGAKGSDEGAAGGDEGAKDGDDGAKGSDEGAAGGGKGAAGTAGAAAAVAPSSAQGPSAGGLPKPDLAAPGSALTVAPGGKPAVAGGTAVAAARVAVLAARLSRARPELTPKQLRAALIGAGDPQRLPPDRTGAGAAREPQPEPGVTADPPTALSGPLDPVSIALNTTASIDVALRATQGATVQPDSANLLPGTPTAVKVRLSRPGATAFGRLVTYSGDRVVASTPWLVRPDTVAPIAVGPLKVSQGRRVRFTLGAFKRGRKTEIQVAERLVLDLVDEHGNVLRKLTAADGARELMPAEYAYTIPRDALPQGAYAFRVRAWAPRQQEPTIRRSSVITP
ncbi:MAG TPA: S8 family serine peptidase [Solirubrobacter sp.]|nr:S8 family serine peptidase [Solirubrobacter sp.]